MMKEKQINQTGFEELQSQTLERLKELATINRTTAIIKEGKSKSIDIRNLNYGEYFIHFNGLIEKFVKK